MPPTDLNAPCLACEIVAGRVRPPGGVVLREDGLVVHGFAGASPVRGWLVLTTARHARGLYDLTPEEAARVGALSARVQRAQRAVLGADHAYAFAIGDALHHVHVHLVPRFADGPAHLRGTRVFDAKPEDVRPPDEIEAAAAALARALAGA